MVAFSAYNYRDSSKGFRLGTWAVPDDFDFPPCKLRAAWMAYLFGFPNNRSLKRHDDGELVLDENEETVMILTPIRPLRFLTDDLLPRSNSKSKRLRKFFRDCWSPILKFMHNANRARIANTHLKAINHDFLQETYDVGVEALVTRYPDLCTGANAARSHIWAISTWNKKMLLERRKKK